MARDNTAQIKAENRALHTRGGDNLDLDPNWNATADTNVSAVTVSADTHNLPALNGHDDLDAFADLVQDEMILPSVKLTQGTSRPPLDAKQAGLFYNVLTGDYKPELLVAILAMKRGRTLFAEGDFDSPPLCVSDDAVAPREVVQVEKGNDILLTGPSCGECPFSQWGTARGGKGKGQECQMSYSVLCFDMDEKMPFILRVSGTSISDFLKYFSAGKLGKWVGYKTLTRIGSVARTFDAGQAFVMTWHRDGALDAEDSQMTQQAAAAYRNVDLSAQSEGDVG